MNIPQRQEPQLSRRELEEASYACVFQAIVDEDFSRS